METPANGRGPKFLKVIVEDGALSPPVTALCAGFERGAWRSEQFARYILHSLVEFALNFSERQRFSTQNWEEFVSRAARMVYATQKHESRGEFGELLLHNVLCDHFGSEPAISKIFFKDSRNDTVKGFDAVHVVTDSEGDLELWLGEAKFYGDVTDAMTAAAREIREHTEHQWLRNEFLCIQNKVDPAWPHSKRFLELIHRNTSIDEIFPRIRIPILITYDSDSVNAHPDGSDPYPEVCEREARELQARFAGRKLPTHVIVHLLLVPLRDKDELVTALDTRLRQLQAL